MYFLVEFSPYFKHAGAEVYLGGDLIDFIEPCEIFFA